MFIRSVMGIKGMRNTLNYGAEPDTLSLPCPQPALGIRGRTSIAEEMEDVPPDKACGSTLDSVIEIEGGQRPACVAELIALHYR